MTNKQQSLELFQVSHKLLVIEHNKIFKVIPVINSINYTIWLLSNVYEFNVVAVLQGKHDEINKVCPPMSFIKSVNSLKESCENNNISFTFISKPSVPTSIPKELLYNSTGDNFNILFEPDEIALLRCNLTEGQECIKKIFISLLKDINDGNYIKESKNGYSYFDSYIFRLSLLGGIKGKLDEYPSKDNGTKLSATSVANVLNKHRQSLYRYRERYMNDLYEPHPVKPVDYNVNIKIYEVTLTSSQREYYETQIAPYVSAFLSKEN